MTRFALILSLSCTLTALGCVGDSSDEFECRDDSCRSGEVRYDGSEDFTGIINIDGDLTVSAVDTAPGLEALETVAGNLIIVDTQLTDLSAFSSLRQINGELHIAGNDRLGSLAGLESLRSVDSVEVRRNDALTTLDGLAPASARNIRIVHNPRLHDLGTLNALEDVSFLEVRYNVSLPAENIGLRGTATNRVIFNQP